MKFSVNMGMIDRLFRTVIGIVLVYIGFINEGLIASEILKFILGAIGLINIVSSVAGICPFYAFANINTCRKT